MISQKYFGSKHYFSSQSDCGMTMPLAVQNFKKSIENSRRKKTHGYSLDNGSKTGAARNNKKYY